jgi:hypothetical protein
MAAPLALHPPAEGPGTLLHEHFALQFSTAPSGRGHLKLLLERGPKFLQNAGSSPKSHFFTFFKSIAGTVPVSALHPT